jgi:hypothetical protein
MPFLGKPRMELKYHHYDVQESMKLILINEEDTLDNIYERRGMTLVSVLFA